MLKANNKFKKLKKSRKKIEFIVISESFPGSREERLTLGIENLAHEMNEQSEK